MTMQRPDIPLARDLVLLGGGHAHALVLRMFGMKPLPGLRITLVNPAPVAAYSGMLPGHVAGHYAREALDIDLVRLARFAGARLVIAEATGIDTAARRVELKGRPPIGWDVLSIDIGIHAAMPELPGFAAHAVPAKPLDAFADAWAAFAARAAGFDRPARIAVLGGGVAGVELALAMAFRLGAAAGGPGAEVTVLEAGAQALPGLGQGARAALMAHAARAGVRIVTGARAVRIGPGRVELADGSAVAADFILGAAGARPHGWLKATGLPLEEGFIRVGPTLQVEGWPEIFAAGDCAHLVHAPRPKAGVYAVRAAPVLFANLRAVLEGRGRMRRFRPQRDFLKLISTGGKGAVADKFGLRLDGRALWRWKDRIDRRFMARFDELPRMAPPSLPRHRAAGVDAALGGKPLCGGCGAKLGPGALAQALAGLAAPERDDILQARGDDAAVLRIGAARQVLSTDHLRAFNEDFGMVARIAAVHALGDVWAMGARPQAALSQIILPRMAARMQAETLREITQAAGEVFAGEGAAIVGGHSTMGAELTIGFTVTGLAGDRVLTKAGAQAGDVLILTKPLGTGVILAAEMAGAARGRDVAAALDMMATPQGAWAAILGTAAHAMTDVTGFGLAGHLAEMTRAAGVGARLDLAALPVLDGAEALAAAGHRSAIWEANRAAVPELDAPDTPRAALLCDPQTGGGLLAAVPAAQAEAVLARLVEAGAPAVAIGEITDHAPHIVGR